MKFLLPFLTAMLAVQSASAQSLWRNFFTTNRDPIVEVVAGSNATVQATTVGSNLRRFTVNSTATGSGTNSLVQTNISWTAVTNLQSAQVPYTVITNAPWQYGDSDLTNWATLNTNVLSTLGQTNISYTAVTNAPWQMGDSDLTNWATLNTNILSTLGQTNISYTAVTNAPWQYGGANLTNWNQLTTNVLAFLANNQTFTGSNHFTIPLVSSVASNTPSASQVLTATSASSAAWQSRVVRSVGISVDGGGSAITAGTKGYISVPYAGTIQSCTLMASPSGSIEFRLWRTNSADGSFPPTSVGAIGTNSLTSDNYNVDSTLTGWTTSLAAGDVLGFNIPATATTITNCTLQLKIQP